ncbi:MAG: hypothetical protein EOO77_02735 [Oxalobacteraceae bacterium]|nr:MAG: hypothetical protein EOO77_02735 [Oxalobacteraceae bacterium]
MKVYLRPMERIILDRLLAGGAGGCSVPLLLEDLGLPMTTKGKGTLQSHIYNLRARLALLAPHMKVANATDSTSYRIEPEPRFAATGKRNTGEQFDYRAGPRNHNVHLDSKS